VADACSTPCLGVETSERPWVSGTAMPAWWVEVACLDDGPDRAALRQARFLSHAGEALAEARCRYFGAEYRAPARGSVPVPGADRAEPATGTGWFAENHPTLGRGAGCGKEPSDPVAHLQTLLGVLVDGRFGYLTQWALQAVQRRFGLDGDGICGPSTWAVLHSIERQGSVGYGSKEIQRELGLYDDGVFGPVTAVHVEAFQRASDTIPDGRFDHDHYRLLLTRPR
jgi:peptidoglycan hydrolase-like protein with peptidoglycan-binding domain